MLSLREGVKKVLAHLAGWDSPLEDAKNAQRLLNELFPTQKIAVAREIRYQMASERASSLVYARENLARRRADRKAHGAWKWQHTPVDDICTLCGKKILNLKLFSELLRRHYSGFEIPSKGDSA